MSQAGRCHSGPATGTFILIFCRQNEMVKVLAEFDLVLIKQS